MIEFAVYATRTAPPSKEQTEKRASLLEQVSFGITDITFRVTPGECSNLILLILGGDILTIPEVKLLIPLLIRVIIGETDLHLFPRRLGGTPLQKLQILLPLLLDELPGQVLINILLLGVDLLAGLEFLQMLLDEFVELGGQLPQAGLGFEVEVVVALVLFVEVDLEREDQFVDFFGVHV